MTRTGKIGLIVEGLIFILFLFLAPQVLAENDSQFVTIINPVRISSYLKSPKASVSSQYSEIKKRKLPATWLLSFDALEDPGIFSVVKSMDKNQELGVLLEITPAFAKTAGVEYHDTGFWHHATSVFLSGYTQEERKLFIDTVFEKFKTVFGFYPTSVGSWWTDSYSLSYMKEKYGITANLICSDQFATDGYQIWGQYWSTPYYPSKYHTGVPAVDESVKLDLVTIQWAPRDPLNGYYNSLFSTQDYQTTGKNLDIKYFEKLVNLYALKHDNQFGQITVGLEADLNPKTYSQEYAKQLDVVNKFSKEGLIEVLTMKDFSSWYQEKFPKLSPPQKIVSEDFLGTKTKVVWLQSPNNRLFYEIDEKGGIKIKDLRIYNRELQEPYYTSPNRSFNLSINIPSVFDQVGFEENVLKLPAETDVIPWLDKIIAKEEKEIVPKDGVLLKGFTSEAQHFFKQKKAVLELLSGRGWNYFKRVNYLIPQGEIYALKFLSSLSKGKVMVFEGECLQCEYHTKFKPPAFANLRNYVQKYAKHPLVFNSSVFKAKTREEAKKEFNKLKVKYVYLVKFESYFEQLPFSPGDLGVEKIYSNANAEIWRVK